MKKTTKKQKTDEITALIEQNIKDGKMVWLKR